MGQEQVVGIWAPTTPEAVPNRNAISPRPTISIVLPGEELIGLHGRADRQRQYNDDNIHHLVGGGLGEALGHQHFLKPVGQHQHGDQRGDRRQQQVDQNANDDGKGDALHAGDDASASSGSCAPAWW